MNGQIVVNIIQSDIFGKLVFAEVLNLTKGDDDFTVEFVPMFRRSSGVGTGYQVQVKFRSQLVLSSETIRSDPYGFFAKRQLRKTIRKGIRRINAL